MKKCICLLCLSLVLACCKKIAVDNPQGFAQLATRDQYAATSPEGMIYRVRLMKNAPEQTLAFWAEALATHLKQQGYVQATSDTAFDAGKIPGLFSEWTVPYRSETYKYFTGVLVTKQVVAVAEAAADHVIYAKHRAAILDSLKTVDFEGVRPPKLADARAALAEVSRVSATVVPKPTTAAPKPSTTAPKAEQPSSRGCFLQGTLILTEDRLTPIDAIWPGTLVSAYDPSTGSWVRQEVLRTVSLAYRGDIVSIEIAGQTIRVTGNHPFLVADGRQLDQRPPSEELSASESTSPIPGRWVEARHLQKGDALLSLHGPRPRIDSISTSFAAAQVYHLAISGPHTYAVDGVGIVVHNGGSAERAKAPLESDRAVREREIMAAGTPKASLPADAQGERIRVYSGACTVKLDSVEQAKRQISTMAQKVGGYVEQSSDKGIVVRVPAADFRRVFDDILGLGEVLYKAIETYDVTDQFTDPKGRLAVAIKARDRLYALLTKVKNVKERLEILKKIREYADTIERLELSLQVIEQRIAMSRITVDLLPRLEETETTEKPIPFAWIERLHPLYASTADLGGKASVVLPDDVALFQEKGALRAEAADGTRVRIGTSRNDPRGDSSFWQQALLYHLKPRYQRAEAIDVDAMKAALFTSKDRKPFSYLVGAIPLKNEPALIVFEVYFPDEAARTRHMGSLLDSFRKVQLK